MTKIYLCSNFGLCIPLIFIGYLLFALVNNICDRSSKQERLQYNNDKRQKCQNRQKLSRYKHTQKMHALGSMGNRKE